MKALISPNEPVYLPDGTTGQRVAQVVADDGFPVADPLFWLDCAADVVADQFYFDGSAIVPVPVIEQPLT